MIDPETCMPTLENVMSNYMQCNQMMFGSRVRYGISYKTNQRNFSLYRRKYWHDFKVPIQQENLEGSIGLELVSINCFLVSKIDKIIMYDSETFKEVNRLPIKLIQSETREPSQVIAM